MGLLFSDTGTGDIKGRQEDALYNRMGCKICPLREVPGRIDATGAKQPLVYIIGEAPGKDEMRLRSQFVGESGQLLRPRIPKRWLPYVRWNNSLNCQPPRNRTPEHNEIECCRPRWAADIEQSQPEAIFGFGGVPLQALTGFTGITLWRGRRMPLRVGTHACWYYPMFHPSFLLRLRREEDRDRGAYIGSEEERMFCFDLEDAFREVEAGLPTPDVHDEKRARAGVEIITEGGWAGVQKITEALRWAAEQPGVGVDYETNGLRPYARGAKILTAAVGTLERAVAFPFCHREAQFDDDQLQAIIQLWIDFLTHSGPKYVHNLSFEQEWTGYFFGENLLRACLWEDTASQAAVIDERRGKSKPGCFSLEWLVQQYYGFNLKKLSNLDKANLDREPLPAVLRYNAMDAKYHYGLGRQQNAVIHGLDLEPVYDLSLRRVPTVTLAQLKGVPVDQAEVKLLQKKYDARVRDIEQEIQTIPIIRTFNRIAGRPFVPLSNKDCLEVFYRMLKRRECVVRDKYSKQSRFSCDEEVLTQIDHPLAPLIVRMRKANRQKSTYIDPLARDDEDTVIYPDGLVHANFNTYWAETGRLSCEEPNLQNFPKREDEAKEVRRIVAALLGSTFLSFDYGQIEARVIAMFTQDPAFCKALWERYDVHMEWAQRLAYAYPSRIGGRNMLTDKKAMKDFRTDIKNQWTFPLFFGAQLGSVANYLNIPEHILKPLFNEFWKQFAGVKEWQEEQLKFYRKYGFIECLTGRRRHGPMSPNKIFNTPVQGTAADIVMDAMCRLSESGDPQLQPELQIHDDLTFLRVPDQQAEAVAEKIITYLLDVPFKWVNVPITVELFAGTNWMPYDKKINPDGLQEIGTYSSDEWFHEGKNDTARSSKVH